MAEFDRWIHTHQSPPRPGQVAIGCGHTPRTITTTSAPDASNLSQWFELAAPQQFGAVVGSWLVSCAACLAAAGGIVQRVTFREHWTVTGATASTHDHLARLADMVVEDEHDRRRRTAAYLEELGETDPGALVRVARAIGVKGL